MSGPRGIRKLESGSWQGRVTVARGSGQSEPYTSKEELEVAAWVAVQQWQLKIRGHIVPGLDLQALIDADKSPVSVRTGGGPERSGGSEPEPTLDELAERWIARRWRKAELANPRQRGKKLTSLTTVLREATVIRRYLGLKFELPAACSELSIEEEGEGREEGKEKGKGKGKEATAS